MRLAFAPYLLKFNFPGGTSRGVLTEKPTFLIKIFDEHDPEHFGIGEAGVFPGLSPEADGNYVNKLLQLMANVALGRPTDLSHHPSIQAGFEQAIRDYTGGCREIYYPTPFSEGQDSITINGLIWMGDFSEMERRIEEKLNAGFRCLKVKIGAIAWEKETELIKAVRSTYGKDRLAIRVDANGAFGKDDALGKLEELARLDVESIEQPVRAGNISMMSRLCRESPLPIALDEELIGKFTGEDKRAMLDAIMPQYVILKPSLIGGFSGAEEWIALARERNIGWWVTSALESNVGLNAIAQWTSTLPHDMPQGLGTGGVFSNNFSSRLYLDGERLRLDPDKENDRHQYDSLHWHQ